MANTEIAMQPGTTAMERRGTNISRHSTTRPPSMFSRGVKKVMHFATLGRLFRQPRVMMAGSPTTILREEDLQKDLAISFSWKKKWWALFVLSVVQVSLPIVTVIRIFLSYDIAF